MHVLGLRSHRFFSHRRGLLEPSILAAAALLLLSAPRPRQTSRRRSRPTCRRARRRSRARTFHAAPFPLEQVCALFGAWRQSSTWRSCSCATRCSSSPWCGHAAFRRVCSAAPCTGSTEPLFAKACTLCSAALTRPRAARSACASRLWTRAAAIASRPPACCRPGCARAVPALRELHLRCRPGPRAAVARPAAVCVRRLPPRAEVRATPRTQPLTAHAHVLTVCCARVLEQERGRGSAADLAAAASRLPIESLPCPPGPASTAAPPVAAATTALRAPLAELW